MITCATRSANALLVLCTSSDIIAFPIHFTDQRDVRLLLLCDFDSAASYRVAFEVDALGFAADDAVGHCRNFLAHFLKMLVGVLADKFDDYSTCSLLNRASCCLIKLLKPAANHSFHCFSVTVSIVIVLCCCVAVHIHRALHGLTGVVRMRASFVVIQSQSSATVVDERRLFLQLAARCCHFPLLKSRCASSPAQAASSIAQISRASLHPLNPLRRSTRRAFAMTARRRAISVSSARPE